MASSGKRTSAGRSSWLVEYHQKAVEEFAGLRDAKQKQGVLKLADFLRQLGPKIKEPHMKPVQGTKKLAELRPSGGKALVRPLYFRHSESTFKIVAIAPEAQVDRAGFDAGVRRAQKRAKEDYGVEV